MNGLIRFCLYLCFSILFFVPTGRLLAIDILDSKMFGNIIPDDSEVVLKLGNLFDEEEIEIEGLDPNSINVLVWNIYKGGRESFVRDYSILSKNKDIIVLQEGYLSSELKKLFNSHQGYEYYFATSFMDEDDLIPTGVMTGSNIQATQVYFQRSKEKEPIYKTPKMTIFSEYAIAGYAKKLLVANIHGLNFTDAEYFLEQVDQAIRYIKKHNGPVIFAGDFNTRDYPRINGLEKMIKDLGLIEVKFKPDLRKTFLSYPLDHIYYKGLMLRSSKTYDVDGSDHAAMSAEFYLPALLRQR